MARSALPCGPRAGEKGFPRMLRPAVITDEITQDFERALDVMLEYGVRDAALRGLWGANVRALSPEEMEPARKAFAERALRACGIASPLYKTYLLPRAEGDVDGPLHLAQERSLDDQLTLLERAIDLTRYFDTNLVRIFAFWRQGALTDEVFDKITAALRPAAARAQEAGVILGLENEHSCFLGTGEETARALREINSPALRGVWDPGNAYMSGEDAYPVGYRAMQPYTEHVHIKDAVR